MVMVMAAVVVMAFSSFSVSVSVCDSVSLVWGVRVGVRVWSF